jgi:hypothetical protein
VGAGAEPPAGLINLGSAGGAEGIDEKEEDAGGLHADWLLMEGWADERGGRKGGTQGGNRFVSSGRVEKADR